MSLATVLLFAACTSDPEEDAGASGAKADDTASASCAATIIGIEPADGTLSVALDATVVAAFSEPVSAADIQVDGAAGTVILAPDGTSATWSAADQLAPGTSYVVTARACGSVSTAVFTTVGEPLPVDLAGHTYDVELTADDLTWVSPSLGPTLAPELGTDRILFMVEAADTGRLDVVGAAGHLFRGETPAQYPCTYAFDFAPAPFVSHPAFAVGPLTAELESSGIYFDLYDLTITGTLSEDGGEATDLVVTGLLDTRPLSEGLGVDVCALALTFGDWCIDCPDGEGGCLALEIHDESAPWREGLTLDVAQDPTTDRYCD